MADRHGFWAQGPSRHHEALNEAEQDELAPMEEELLRASWARQVELKLKMESVRKKYSDLRESSTQNLYLGPGVGEG